MVGVLFEGCLRRDAVERLAIEDIARLLGPSSWGSPGHTEEPVPAMYQAANTGATAASPQIFGAVPTKAVPVPAYAQLTVPAAARRNACPTWLCNTLAVAVRQLRRFLFIASMGDASIEPTMGRTSITIQKE